MDRKIIHLRQIAHREYARRVINDAPTDYVVTVATR